VSAAACAGSTTCVFSGQGRQMIAPPSFSAPARSQTVCGHMPPSASATPTGSNAIGRGDGWRQGSRNPETVPSAGNPSPQIDVVTLRSLTAPVAVKSERGLLPVRVRRRPVVLTSRRGTASRSSKWTRWPRTGAPSAERRSGWAATSDRMSTTTTRRTAFVACSATTATSYSDTPTRTPQSCRPLSVTSPKPRRLHWRPGFAVCYRVRAVP